MTMTMMYLLTCILGLDIILTALTILVYQRYLRSLSDKGMFQKLSTATRRFAIQRRKMQAEIEQLRDEANDYKRLWEAAESSDHAQSRLNDIVIRSYNELKKNYFDQQRRLLDSVPKPPIDEIPT